MFGGSAVELTTQALFELAHATPLCRSPKSGEGDSGGAHGLSEEERVRVYESLTKLDFSIAAPARGPPPYMHPVQYFDVPSNRWHSLECHIIGYKDNPNDQDLAEHSSYGIYPSLDRVGMAACVAWCSAGGRRWAGVLSQSWFRSWPYSRIRSSFSVMTRE